MFNEPERFLRELVLRMIPTPDFLKPPGDRPSTDPRPRQPQPARTKNEQWYRDDLHRQVGGQIEVELPDGGRIDILTATELIEVKAARNWRHALGQVLDYGKYYPYHQKRIHLFGKLPAMGLLEIRQSCQDHGVKVTWKA